MDGADVDLVKFCGLPPLTDRQHDTLWGEMNETALLELCLKAELCFSEGSDDMPGSADSYYDVSTNDEAGFKEELKNLILRYSGQN